jgi:serine beta-lactamase-like protein LACTB
MKSGLSNAISAAREVVQTELVSKLPGVSIAVAVNGEMAWSEQFGYADIEAKIPVVGTTRFRVGSVSKPLTAAVLALLVEKEALDLDAPIQKYIPDFPEKNGVLTTRLLAGHLTGIRNYRGLEASSNKPYPDLRSGLKIFENDPLETPLGTKFSYASYNWNVVGVAMEAAAKQDFIAFMGENVIQPLGLVNTLPDRAGMEDSQRARFYEIGADGKLIASPQVDLSYAWPSGGFLSTAEDIVRFGIAHLKPGFLKPESLRLLLTSQKTNTGDFTNYGVGWFTRQGLVHHGGDSFGGTAILLLIPAMRIVVAFAGNGGQGLLHNMMRKGRVSSDARKFLIPKEAVAIKIAKAFVPIVAKCEAAN